MLIKGAPVVQTDINAIVIHYVLYFSDLFTCQRVMLDKLIGSKGRYMTLQNLLTDHWSPIRDCHDEILKLL